MPANGRWTSFDEGNTRSAVILRVQDDPDPPVDNDCDFKMMVYDEPYCRGNSAEISKSYDSSTSLQMATSALAGPIRSMSHPGKTRVDLYSEQFHEGTAFRSRNDKDAETND